MDTGFNSKGKGNDWKASHKITQWRSQEESLTVPEALANSSCSGQSFHHQQPPHTHTTPQLADKEKFLSAQY